MVTYWTLLLNSTVRNKGIDSDDDTLQRGPANGPRARTTDECDTVGK